MFTPGSRACGYRTASGRAKWPNRDPINEPGFKLLTSKREAFDWDEEKNLYAFVRNSPIDYVDALGNGLCVCVFKGRTGKLTINSNCKGVLAIWVIDEGSAAAAGATAGTTVSADGYVMGGTTYKIDGSTCVDINCAGGSITISCCANCLAMIRGSRCPPYAVAAGSFGGPPKEPTPGSTPPVAK